MTKEEILEDILDEFEYDLVCLFNSRYTTLSDRIKELDKCVSAMRDIFVQKLVEQVT